MELKIRQQQRAMRKLFVRQQDERDCGVACLLSVIRYYKGERTLEQLRRISGTSVNGTTLLGLYEAAKVMGFEAQGCEADIPSLMEHPAPCILHVLMPGGIQHYLVVYGYEKQDGEVKFLISDPARGVSTYTGKELEDIWQSRACLILSPSDGFELAEKQRSDKQQWLLYLLKEDTQLLVLATGLGIGVAALNMVMALFSQRLLDDIIPQRNFFKFNMGVSLLVLLLIIKELANMLRQYMLLRQSLDFNKRIIGNFFKRILQLPKVFFDTRKIGELTARLNDTSRIQKFISQVVGNVIIDGLLVIISIGFLFSYSLIVGAIVICFLPLYFLLIYIHQRAVTHAQQQMMSGYALVESNYIATIRGIETIKHYNRQDLFADGNEQAYGHYQGFVFRLGRIQVKLALLANLLGIVYLAGIIIYTVQEVFAGHLKTGEMMAILGICVTLLPAVANLALLALPLQEAKVAFDRMFEFVGIVQEDSAAVITTDTPVWQHLEVKELSFRFPGRRPLLQHVSMEVSRHEIVALVGESGSGKSTLMQLLERFYMPDSGQLIVNGNQALGDWPLAAWRRVIGVVPQQVHIFNGSILENIAFEDAAQKPAEVLRFLAEYGFTSYLGAFPQGPFTLVGEEGLNLSGGQQQLVALARALYHRPQLLILDEATAAMDRNTEHFVIQQLQQLKAQMGIIFISHRLHVLKMLVDRIYIMEGGTIVEQGNHHQLMHSDNLYSAYWNDYAGGMV